MKDALIEIAALALLGFMVGLAVVWTVTRIGSPCPATQKIALEVHRVAQ